MTADPAAASRPVLVVEGGEQAGSTMVRALRNRGHQAYRCPTSSRSEILTTAAGFAPGLVLLDLDLGRDTDGRPLDAVDLVADLRDGGWQVVVVITSPDQDRLEAAVVAGVDGVFLRTAELPRFLDLVEQVRGYERTGRCRAR